MCGVGPFLFAGFEIPNLECTVGSTAGNQQSVRFPGNAKDMMCMALKRLLKRTISYDKLFA